jgi:ABC-2 type transport system permease protein
MIKQTWFCKYPIIFEKDLVKENEAKLFMAINAINGTKANLGGAYLRTIIQDYNKQVRTEWIQFPKIQPRNTNRGYIIQLVQSVDEL